jgi:hypothetical protein
MLGHELAIMKERKGGGFYYLVFSIIYSTKEGFRNLVKKIWMKLTGKMMR